MVVLVVVAFGTGPIAPEEGDEYEKCYDKERDCEHSLADGSRKEGFIVII